MAAVLLLLLATSALAFQVPTPAANRFFDTILQKSFSRHTSDIIVPDRRFEYLGLTIQLGDIHVSGPSSLLRKGDAEMEQMTFKTQASSAVLLGKIDYAIRNLVIDFIGFKFTTSVTFTLENASTTSRVYVVQRDRDNCEGSTLVNLPSGSHKVYFQSQSGFHKILEYLASAAIEHHLLSVGDIFQFADLTKSLETELNASVNEIFC